MARYIDIVKKLKHLEDTAYGWHYNGKVLGIPVSEFEDILSEAAHIIENQPTADVKPIVRGEWADHYKSGFKVSEGYVSTCCDMWNKYNSHFCPKCGADMRKESE